MMLPQSNEWQAPMSNVVVRNGFLHEHPEGGMKAFFRRVSSDSQLCCKGSSDDCLNYEDEAQVDTQGKAGSHTTTSADSSPDNLIGPNSTSSGNDDNCEWGQDESGSDHGDFLPTANPAPLDVEKLMAENARLMSENQHLKSRCAPQVQEVETAETNVDGNMWGQMDQNQAQMMPMMQMQQMGNQQQQGFVWIPVGFMGTNMVQTGCWGQMGQMGQMGMQMMQMPVQACSNSGDDTGSTSGSIEDKPITKKKKSKGSRAKKHQQLHQQQYLMQLAERNGGNINMDNAPDAKVAAKGNSSGEEGAASGDENDEELVPLHVQRRMESQRGMNDQDNITDVPVPERTTVMLRNLPNNYTRHMLLTMLDREGFARKYDFVYLPIDFKTRASLGYAFINLVTPNLVARFWKTFDGYSNWILPSRKVCFVTWCGPNQGYEAHVQRYRHSPVMHTTVPDEYKPVIFKNGVRIKFPPPAKKARVNIRSGNNNNNNNSSSNNCISNNGASSGRTGSKQSTADNSGN